MIDTGFLLNLYLKSLKRRFGFYRFNMGFTLGLEKERSFGTLLCYCMKKKSVTCLLELLTMDLGFGILYELFLQSFMVAGVEVEALSNCFVR